MKVCLYYSHLIDENKFLKYTNGFERQDIYDYLLYTFDFTFLKTFKLTDGVHQLLNDENYISYIDGLNYFYPVALHWWLHWSESENFWKSKFTIPEDVILDLKNKKTKIIMYNLLEGWEEDVWLKYIEIIIDKYKFLTLDDFVVICNNLVYTKLNNVSYLYQQSLKQSNGYFNNYNSLCEEIIKNIRLKKERTKKFVCLNRRPTPGRFALLTEISEDIDLGYFSFCYDTLVDNTARNFDIFSEEYKKQIHKNFIDNEKVVQGYMSDFKSIYPNIYNKFIVNEIWKYIPKFVDDNVDPRSNPTTDNSVFKFTDSYLHIITETFIHNTKNHLSFSEKTFKAIYYMQPFIIIGQKNSLMALEEYGYNTFSKWIDNSYDEIDNDELRIKSAINSAKKFYNQPTEILNEILLEMLPFLISNKDLLIKNTANNSNYISAGLEKMIR